MRHFNTTGPVNPDDHYYIPPLERVPLKKWCRLVQQKKYFVVHAPRQTGKTSALLAFRDHLNSGRLGDIRCLYVNIEPGQTARDNVGRAVSVVLDKLIRAEQATLGDHCLEDIVQGLADKTSPDSQLSSALELWARADSRPLVLLIDEIDALVGDSLVSVLRQLRSSYHDRSQGFPQSVVLCGLRNMRDYRIESPDGKSVLTEGSPFNIAADSLRLSDFTQEDVNALLAQHTADTGQEYSPEAQAAIWHYTQGQPWLVNALANEICEVRDYEAGAPVLTQEVDDAKEALVLRRVVHLDYLMSKLKEGRVRRVIEPMLIGADYHDGSELDLKYVRDLGLIARESERIANPIYMEVIPRELTYLLQSGVVERDLVNCTNPDGSLNMTRLMEGFQAFFQQNAEHWRERFDYKEAAYQLLLQAYLQGKVNGRGRIEREYALGSRRVDLAIFWRQGGRETSFVIECKTLYDSLEKTLADGLAQTAGYMGTAGAAEGHLVIFDKSDSRGWDEKIFHRTEAQDGKTIEVWGA